MIPTGKDGVVLPFDDLPAPQSKADLIVPNANRKDARSLAATLSHEDLTRLGCRWLRNRGFTSFRETTSIYGNEVADVIGWNNRGSSILIECKRSRGDFMRDKLKDCRRFDDLSFGCFRYYLCPAGMLDKEEVPPKWGLFWAYEKRIVIVKKSGAFDPQKAAIAEKKLLTALLYRLENDLRDVCQQTGRKLPARIDL